MKNRLFLLGFLALFILLEGCAAINRSIQLENEWQRTKNIEPLINALQDESSFVRGTSIEILGKTKDPRAVEPLIAVLKEDKSWQIREKAAEALGEIKDPRAVEPLIAVLKEDESWEEREVRKKAIRPLGEIKDPRAVEPLIAVLKEDKSREVRENVIWALGEIKGSSCSRTSYRCLKRR
jgi:HEAT repeat protein